MADPTEPVIMSTFVAALGVFTIGAVVKSLSRRHEEVPAGDAEGSVGIPDEGDAPYSPPVARTLPPDLLRGRVPTWFYNPCDLLGIGFVFLVFSGLVLMSLRASAKAEVVLDPGALLAAIGVQFIGAFIVMSFVLVRINPVTWLGLKWKAWHWIFIIAPVAVLTMWAFFAGLSATGFMKWVESLGVEPVQDSVKLLQESKDPLVIGLMVFAAVVAAPVCEEIVFRGYLYAAAKKFAGPWAACIASALVFGAAHGSLAALLPLVVFGGLLVFAYEKTGSIWAPMAIHFCFNGATVAVQLAARVFNIPLDAP